MGYTILQPDARLAPFVESLWVQELPADAPNSEVTTHILPVGRTELVIDFGDPFLRVGLEGEDVIPTQVYLGQRTRPMAVRGTGRTGLVIVSFYPWAASFFGPADVLADRGTVLSDLIAPDRCRQLEDEAGAAQTTEERARAVERLLLERLPRRVPDRRLLEGVMRLGRAHGGGTAQGASTWSRRRARVCPDGVGDRYRNRRGALCR